MKALVLALLATLGVAGQEPRPSVPATRTLMLSPLLPSRASIVRDQAHRLRVAVPSGWVRGDESLLPRMARPERSILALATFEPHAEPRRACGNFPDMPHVTIGPRAALLHVEEQLEAYPGSKPTRPGRFRLKQQTRRPGRNEPVASVFPWRCLNRVGIVGLWTSFRAHSRLMHLTAVAGERTSRRQRRELVGIAESLRFGP